MLGPLVHLGNENENVHVWIQELKSFIVVKFRLDIEWKKDHIYCNSKTLVGRFSNWGFVTLVIGDL